MEPRDKSVRVTLTASELDQIVQWMKDNDLAEFGRSTSLRLMAMLAAKEELKPTEDEIQQAVPRKLEKGESSKVS